VSDDAKAIIAAPEAESERLKAKQRGLSFMEFNDWNGRHLVMGMAQAVEIARRVAGVDPRETT
jgi:hypothetical protein